ncbi:MAG: ATP-binding cassette domain-containing protein [Coriobacteriia bacterium]|nr:ATP-binding cassette domain-containing protein [Coriobacteriia bacterium]
MTATRPGDDGPHEVFAGVDLEVDAGTLTDIVGPSGSGKTTLLLALARLLGDVSGELTLDGADASGLDPRVWRTRVAYLPQRASLVSGTVGDNLTLPWLLKVRAGQSPPAMADLRQALDGVGLDDIALDRDVSRLSVGQAARIALLRTILTGPDVLLLDEPDASLDDASAAQVARMTTDFVDRGGAVVRVRHARTDAGADRRYRLDDGRLTELTERD